MMSRLWWLQPVSPNDQCKKWEPRHSARDLYVKREENRSRSRTHREGVVYSVSLQWQQFWKRVSRVSSTQLTGLEGLLRPDELWNEDKWLSHQSPRTEARFVSLWTWVLVWGNTSGWINTLTCLVFASINDPPEEKAPSFSSFLSLKGTEEKPL